jgi:hypothetical protein
LEGEDHAPVEAKTGVGTDPVPQTGTLEVTTAGVEDDVHFVLVEVQTGTETVQGQSVMVIVVAVLTV